MADIAMLVAEEYERRVKNPRKGEVQIAAAAGESDAFSASAGFWAGTRLKNDGSLISWTMEKKPIGEEENLQIFKPKTQIGLAAINGFFSA